jgi:hypothetical protein
VFRNAWHPQLAQSLYSLMRERKGETLTGTVKGERDATEYNHQDCGRDEPPPLGGGTVGVFRLVLGRSTAKAAARPRDHEAQPGLLSARCVVLGSA